MIRAEDPGIESLCRRYFSHPSRPSLGPPGLPYNDYQLSFPGVKRPGRGVNRFLPSSSEVKERVQLCLYSSSGPSWPVLRRILSSLFIRWAWSVYPRAPLPSGKSDPGTYRNKGWEGFNEGSGHEGEEQRSYVFDTRNEQSQ